MKRNISSYWLLLILLIIGVGAFTLFLSVVMPTRYPASKRAQCQVKLMQIGIAMAMYTHDYQRLPPAIFPGETVGWAKGLQPYMKDNPDYLKSPQIFQCPSVSHPVQDDPHLPGFTDYWMNRNVAGADFSELKVSFKVILMGDGDGNSPASTASYSIDRLPKSWLKGENTPAKRHHGGAIYLLRDWHAEWLKPNQVSQLPSSENPSSYTFSIR